MVHAQLHAQPLRDLRPLVRLRAAVVAALGVLCLACGSSGRPAIKAVTVEEAGTRAPEAKLAAPRIALIMKTLTNPFFLAMEKGARRAQQEAKLDLQVRAATMETSIDQQIQLVEDEIGAKAKAIVIAPCDSTRLVPVLKKAQDAGIVCVNIDNQLNPEAMAGLGMRPVPFISVNNEEGAYQAVKYVADQIKAPTEAAVLEGMRTAYNGQQRKRGAERGFHTNPAIRIVAEESANWKIDEAYVLTRKLFQLHPKLGVLFCANDMMAIGAIKYLQETGRTKVKVIGFDALDEARTAVQAGQMAVTVNQQADQQGYLGVMTALKLLQRPASEALPKDLEVRTVLVTAGTR
jgi:ribose transport system substrate-binding protein